MTRGASLTPLLALDLRGSAEEHRHATEGDGEQAHTAIPKEKPVRARSPVLLVRGPPPAAVVAVVDEQPPMVVVLVVEVPPPVVDVVEPEVVVDVVDAEPAARTSRRSPRETDAPKSDPASGVNSAVKVWSPTSSSSVSNEAAPELLRGERCRGRCRRP